MGATMSAEAIEARKNYQRKYRCRNRDKINSQRRKWQSKNREKVQEYNQRYWQKIAEENQNLRASYAEFGIDKTRLNELQEIVRSGEYDDLVESAAHMANKEAATHIILSVKKGLSYEGLEAKQALGEIERIALGRTDFYGTKRLFFHYLDLAMKEVNADRRGEVT